MLLVLAGCPWVTDDAYDLEVRDQDGDGEISIRFGGPDCLDTNPDVANCDADEDGFLARAAGGDDCDDGDATVFPDAPEICDSQDNDCDGAIDNDDPQVVGSGFFVDADGDGAGDPGRALACQFYVEGLGVHATAGDDCNDQDAGIHPQATELCDGVDNDCDGNTDDVGLWLTDDDLDGFGRDGTQTVGACDLLPGSGSASAGGDCDDTDDTVFPGASEVPYDGLDTDCDGGLDDWDLDQDGHVPSIHFAAAQAANAALGNPWMLADGDCDDTDGRAHADALEVCDGVDNDCDGSVDAEDLLSNLEPLLESQIVERWIDVDGDGAAGTPVQICPVDLDPQVHFAAETDCYDGGTAPLGYANIDPASVFDDADEICDGLDNDCDGNSDFAFQHFPGSSEGWLDGDGDGYGLAPVFACGPDASAGIADRGEDCNDTQPGVFPGAAEICGDSLRQDCSAAHLFDCDGDGVLGLYPGGGLDDDCDDTRADVFPSTAPGAERCDGIDNDCDGLVDSLDLDNLESGDDPAWYLDHDGDGFGVDDGNPVQQCDQPAGYALQVGDCDDFDAHTHPDTVWFVDDDGDGFGDSFQPVMACLQPTGSVAVDGDCDDSQAAFFPGAMWQLDTDGDGVGEGTAQAFCAPPADQPWVPAGSGDPNVGGWYPDHDGDGFGDEDATPVSGFFAGGVQNDGDCDDDNPNAHPGIPIEFCDGVDNNCDGFVIDGMVDVSNPFTGVPLVDDQEGLYFIDGDTDVNGGFSFDLRVETCVAGANPQAVLFTDDFGDLPALQAFFDPEGQLQVPADAVFDCDDGSGTPAVLYAPDLDQDHVGHANWLDDIVATCDGMAPATWVPLDLQAPDCRPTDPHAWRLPDPGNYPNIDGDDYRAALLSGQGGQICGPNAGLPLGAEADCDDLEFDHNGPEAEVGGLNTIPVADALELSTYLAACVQAEFDVSLLTQLDLGEFPIGGAYRLVGPPNGGRCDGHGASGCLNLQGGLVDAAVALIGLDLTATAPITVAGDVLIESSNLTANQFTVNSGILQIQFSNVDTTGLLATMNGGFFRLIESTVDGQRSAASGVAAVAGGGVVEIFDSELRDLETGVTLDGGRSVWQRVTARGVIELAELNGPVTLEMLEVASYSEDRAVVGLLVYEGEALLDRCHLDHRSAEGQGVHVGSEQGPGTLELIDSDVYAHRRAVSVSGMGLFRDTRGRLESLNSDAAVHNAGVAELTGTRVSNLGLVGVKSPVHAVHTRLRDVDIHGGPGTLGLEVVDGSLDAIELRVFGADRALLTDSEDLSIRGLQVQDVQPSPAATVQVDGGTLELFDLSILDSTNPALAVSGAAEVDIEGLFVQTDEQTAPAVSLSEGSNLIVRDAVVLSQGPGFEVDDGFLVLDQAYTSSVGTLLQLSNASFMTTQHGRFFSSGRVAEVTGGSTLDAEQSLFWKSLGDGPVMALEASELKLQRGTVTGPGPTAPMITADGGSIVQVEEGLLNVRTILPGYEPLTCDQALVAHSTIHAFTNELLQPTTCMFLVDHNEFGPVHWDPETFVPIEQGVADLWGETASP